jgi:hypothetical protein
VARCWRFWGWGGGWGGGVGVWKTAFLSVWGPFLAVFVVVSVAVWVVFKACTRPVRAVWLAVPPPVGVAAVIPVSSKIIPPIAPVLPVLRVSIRCYN